MSEIGQVTKTLRILRDRSEILALAAILLFVEVGLPLFKKSVPFGIQGLGVLSGCALALQAIAIVLIYRSNRIINFAQVQIGVVAATFFSIFTSYMPHLNRWGASICPSCFDGIGRTGYFINYWIILVLSMAIAIGLSWAAYNGLIRRFSTAPRLIVTVATIFLAQFLGAIPAYLLRSRSLFTEDQIRDGIRLTARPPNINWTIDTGTATYHAPDILTILVTAMVVVGLVIYLRASSTGVAIRAAADNPSRLETLGVNVNSVNSRVWLIAGALSGAAALLNSMSVGMGGSAGATLSVGSIVRILTAAVIARMFSIPVVVIAAVVFGILEQGVLWVYGSTVVYDGSLLFIIAFVLLLQRYKASRAELEQASEWRAAREVRPIPKELRQLPAVKQWLRTGAGVGGLVLLAFPWVMSPSQTNLAATVMIYTIVFLSLLILTGWAGQISLGQFAFAAVGGYVAAVTRLPILLAILVGALAGAVVALMVGLPALKLRGLHLAVITLAFALSTTQLLLNPNYLGKALPSTLKRPTFLGMNLDSEPVFYFFTLAFLILVVLAVIGVRRSRTGRALIAARDNESAAQSFGINLVRGRLGAFALSGFLAALAGALLAFQQHGVKATAYAPEVSVTMFLITVIGGLGAVSGPLIGGVYQAIIFLGGNTPALSGFLTGGGGIVLLYIAPGGLSQIVFDTRDAILRWIARRNKILVPSLIADVRVGALGRPRALVAPKTKKGAVSVSVPDRYRLGEQWGLTVEPDEKTATGGAKRG